jgi:hypothetical protein
LPGVVLKLVLVGALLGSAAIGFGYGLFYVVPALWTSVKAGDLFGLVGKLVAALGFAVAQVVAGVLALRDRPAFIVWLLPAALYLMAIGVVPWVHAGEWGPLWLDTARGLLLCGLGWAQLRILRGTPRPT